MTRSVPWQATAAVLLAGVLAAAPPVRAQGDGFLFAAPTASFTFRGGFDRAMGRGDLLTFVTNELTLRKGDFTAVSLSGDLNARLGSRLDLVLGAAWSGSRSPSEYRAYVDNNDLPIEQTTSLERVPLTAGLRYYLAPRGESVGRLAWIPQHLAPYVGAGVGAMWYQFRQTGDFVDISTMDVFPDRLTSSNWALTAYAAAGAEVSVTPTLFLSGEARYTWARGRPGGDFSGYDRLDLSGVAVSVGIGFRM